MPTWGVVVLGVAALITAIGVIWKKVISPSATLIVTAQEGAPVFKSMVKEFADVPELMSVLRDIAAQFKADSGTTLRDVVNRLEAAAEANKIALEALVVQEEAAAAILKTGQAASRLLAQEDRVQIATLLLELRGVKFQVDDAAAAATVIAIDLEAAHTRAEERDPAAAPGEAADAAMRRPDIPTQEGET